MHITEGVTMRDTAVLVIDVQQSMFDTEPALYRREEVVAIARDVIERARAAGVEVVYVQHNAAPETPMATGSPGWMIHPEIAPRDGELVVQKWTPDSFHETTLHDELTRRGISKLVVLGMQTEYCVDTSTRRAFSLGYDVTLVSDGHSTWDTDIVKAEQIVAHHNAILGDWFGVAKPADEIEFNQS
jgi:nicotinamidase-related amidase